MTAIATHDGAETGERVEGARLWAARVGSFALLLSAAIVLMHPTALHMVKIWAGSSSYLHGFVVAPLVIWMIAASSRVQLHETGGRAGYVILAGALLFWLAGRAANAALIEQIAFVGAVIGSVGICFGARALRDWAYPLALLFFMVPFGESLVPALQLITANSVIPMLSALGVEASRNSLIIETSAGAFAIAEACAGLRYLLAAMMLASVYTYIRYYSLKKRAIFLLFAALFAVFANVLRAFLIILTAVVIQKDWTLGLDHILFGWAFYSAMFVALILIGERFADRTTGPNAMNDDDAQPIDFRLRPALIGLSCIALASAYATLIVERPPQRAAPAGVGLVNAPGWRILPPPDNWRAPIGEADRIAAATYRRGNVDVYLSMGYFTHDRRGAEIAGEANRAWNGAHWRKIGARRAPSAIFEGASADYAVLAGPGRRRLAATALYWLDGKFYASPWQVKLAQMTKKLRGANPSGGVMIIAASYEYEVEEAIKKITAFVETSEPLALWLQRNRLP